MIKNWVGFYTLSSREIMRFFSVWRQTIIPGIVTTLLYIFVFGVALENRISEIGGVSYKIYILPGLLMMNVITNAVANSASSMLQMKLLQTLPELLITPLSSLELSLSFNCISMEEFLTIFFKLETVSSTINFPLSIIPTLSHKSSASSI